MKHHLAFVLVFVLSCQFAWGQVAENPGETPVESALAALGKQEVEIPKPPQPKVFPASLLSGDEYAALLAGQIPSSFDLLLATISVEEKAAQVSWAPFLGSSTYSEFFSETRLQVGQKDGKSNMGLVLRWNPLSPRGRRGMQDWADSVVTGFGEETAKLRDLRWKALELKDYVLSLEVSEILDLRKEVEILIPQAQEIGISDERRAFIEGKLKTATLSLAAKREEARIARASETSGEIEKLKAEFIATSDPVKKAELAAKMDALFSRVTAVSPALSAIEAEIAAIEKDIAKKGLSSVVAFEERLSSHHVPVVSLAYSVSLFTGLGSSFVDGDGDGLDDNSHSMAGRSLLLSSLLRLSEVQQVSIAVGRSWKRSSAEAGAGLAESDNYAFTWGRRLKLLDPEYKRSDDYLASLFVPSIVGGLSIELSDCRSTVANCPDKAERILAITPFVDVKLRKASQFRLGISWKKFSGSDIADEDLGVVTLVNLQLGLPSN